MKQLITGLHPFLHNVLSQLFCLDFLYLPFGLMCQIIRVISISNTKHSRLFSTITGRRKCDEENQANSCDKTADSYCESEFYFLLIQTRPSQRMSVAVQEKLHCCVLDDELLIKIPNRPTFPRGHSTTNWRQTVK